MPEHRRSPRYACRFAVAAEGPRGPVRGVCTNLSIGGLFFEGAQLPLNALTTVTVDFQLRGSLVVQATVRHHSPLGMGVEFTRLEQGQLALLQQVLSEIAANPLPAATGKLG